MIEAIAKLLNNVSARKAIINVQTDNNGEVTLVLNAFMPPAKDDKETSDVMALRHALSNGLIVNGEIGEIDVLFNEQLANFADGYKKGAEVLRDASTLVSNIDSATNSVTTKTSKAKTKVSEKSNSKPPETSETKPIQASVFDDTEEEESL